MLTTHIETLMTDEGLREITELTPTHYHEVSEHYKRDIPLNPDYHKYEIKECNGEILYITLRDAGQLVGYYIGFIGPALHYKDCLTLALDIIYVTPDSRGQKGGILLLNAVKAEAARRGVRVMTMGCKEAHREHMEQLLIAAGMQPFERHYSLWFD